jgi:hypothetical protein
MMTIFLPIDEVCREPGTFRSHKSLERRDGWTTYALARARDTAVTAPYRILCVIITSSRCDGIHQSNSVVSTMLTSPPPPASAPLYTLIDPGVQIIFCTSQILSFWIQQPNTFWNKQPVCRRSDSICVHLNSRPFKDRKLQHCA